MSTRSLAALAAGAAAALVPSLAHADEEGPPDPHAGFFGGFGLQAGNISCEGDNCPDFREAGGFNGMVGWGFDSKLALAFDVWFMGSKEDNLTITHTIATAGVRYWAVPIIWIQGGLGAASARFSYDAGILGNFETHTDNVPAIAFAAGVELLKSPRFALDLQARVGFGFYKEDEDGDGTADTTGRSASLGVGFTWF